MQDSFVAHIVDDDEAVRRKTGKKWNEWFRILDRAALSEDAIAAYLFNECGIPQWWAERVAERYLTRRSSSASSSASERPSSRKP